MISGFIKEFKVRFNKVIKVLADTKFQGINKFHKDSEIPKKKITKHPLTESEKANNHKIPNKRVKNEHTIAFIECSRIVSEKYRNSRNYFALRFNLISGICNYGLLL